MGDLKNPRMIIAKGMMFLFLGFLSSAIIIANAPQIRIATLLLIAIWAFCRFYYFAFYVIQHYVDPSYKFSGLFSFFKYLLSNRKSHTR